MKVTLKLNENLKRELKMQGMEALFKEKFIEIS